MENNSEIDNFIYETFKNNELHKINNLYLSNRQIDILNKYNIDYKKMVDLIRISQKDTNLITCK